ncbi:MAG: ECF transporter S component [Bacillota bacterium]|nr:ECF transporter S component [Bacillota bacterium]
MDRGKTQTQLLRLTSIGIFAALSIVMLLVIPGIPFPPAPFLKYDMADVPILVASLLYGPVAGIVILVIVSAIQAFGIIGDGIIGFFMHVVASSVLLLIPALLTRRRPGRVVMFVGLGLGAVGMAVAMIFFNLLITPLYTGLERSVIAGMLPPIILFNLMKGGLNAAIAGLVTLALQPLVQRLVRRTL